MTTIVEGTMTAERTDGTCVAHIPCTKTFAIPNILHIIFYQEHTVLPSPSPNTHSHSYHKFYKAAIFTFDKGATSIHITLQRGTGKTLVRNVSDLASMYHSFFYSYPLFCSKNTKHEMFSLKDRRNFL